MKLRELIELTRGLDDKAFLERFACPFLMEEGHLPHESKLKLGRPPTNDVTQDELHQELTEMAERRVFPIRRKDGTVGDVTIGRSSAMDVALEVQSVSTRHAVLKAPGDGRARWVVVDTVSTNGTFVDGVRIATGREVELSDATVVRFGPDLRLAFYEPHQFLRVLRQIASALAAGRPPRAPGVPGERTAANARLKQTPAAGKGFADLLDEVLSEDEKTEVAERPVPTIHDLDQTAIDDEPGRPSFRTAPVARKPRPTDPAIAVPSTGEKTEIDLKVPQVERAAESPRPVPRSPSAASSGPFRAIAASGGADARVVVLACDPFAPLPIEPFRPVVIGRVPGNDFVLPNPQVSRKHCEVERVRDGVVIRDLGSANGTWIDDRKVDRATVPLGGHFQIGPYRLEIRPMDPSHLAQGPSLGDTMVSGPRAADGLRGSFDDMPLTEILSGVEFNQKTGIIDIQGDAGVAGFVSFRGGAPHQARCGKLEGESAVLELLALSHGRFVLRSDEAAVGPRAIDASFTKLLLEHGRLRDEKSKRG